MTASLTRREALTVLTGFVGTALVAPRTLAAGPWSGYGRAIVIDGCGAPGNSVSENSGSLTAALVDDVRRSGLTCISITVGPVGTTAQAPIRGISRKIRRRRTDMSVSCTNGSKRALTERMAPAPAPVPEPAEAAPRGPSRRGTR